MQPRQITGAYLTKTVDLYRFFDPMNTISIPCDRTHPVQHKQSTVQALRYLSAGLRQLTDLFEEDSNTFLSSDASNLIAQVKTALTSLEVELLHQQAISQGIYDFFPTPKPLI